MNSYLEICSFRPYLKTIFELKFSRLWSDVVYRTEQRIFAYFLEIRETRRGGGEIKLWECH